MEIYTGDSGFLNLIWLNQKSVFLCTTAALEDTKNLTGHQHSPEGDHPCLKVIREGRWAALGWGPLAVGIEIWGETLVPGGMERKKNTDLGQEMESHVSNLSDKRFSLKVNKHREKENF